MLISAQSRLLLLFLAAGSFPGLSCGSGTQATHAGVEGGAGPAAQPSAIPSVDAGGGAEDASIETGTPGSGGPPADGSTDSTGDASSPRKTFANPIDIDYYFQTSSPSRKETADPAVVLYKGNYYLFASQGHGYWYSSDLKSWTHVNPDWPTSVFQEWAPACWTLNGVIYFATPTAIYSSVDPMGGHWKFEANNFQNLGDPDYFVDDDGKLYAYYGLSNTQPPHGVQIDPSTFKTIGNQVGFFLLDPKNHGWEVPGDANDEYSSQGWLEGTWMSKHNGTYYLQYACPGTEFASYSDGVYTSKSPLGPFTYAPNNPFSTRLTGFAHSAGHSATFQDTFGNWWHIGNTLIGDKDKYERRVSLYPAGFDADGLLYVNTGLGDFPIVIPSGPSDALASRPEWMLVSYKKSPRASSTLAPTGSYTFDPANAFDEDIKTVWSAATGNVGEWLEVDLGAPVSISAIQSNFAEQGSTFISPQGVATATFTRRYVVETSSDGKVWNLAIDQSNSTRDLAHDYVQLPSSVTARYVRITNRGSIPGGGQFSVRDLRIFGTGTQGASPVPAGVTVARSRTDTRTALVSWTPSSSAIGYLVRYGIAPDKLYDSRQVYDATSCQLNSLDIGIDYYFTVDAISDTEVTRGTTAVKAPAQP
jgi:xylan 1,4-beta-xylosidase